MNKYPDDTFLARWLNGDLSADETQNFEGTKDHAELQRLLAGVDRLAPHPFGGEVFLEKIKAVIAQNKAQKGRIRRINRFLLLAAACTALLVVAYLLWPKALPQPQFAAYEVRVDQKPIQASFPDGSIFALNKSSKIEFDKANWATRRAVNLEGEAYFEVEKGPEFIVSLTKGKVRVLGTKFSVVSRENFLQIECFEGRVEVSGENFARQVLGAGQMYRPIPQKQLPADSMRRKLPEEHQGAEWLEGISQLTDMTLKQIALEFEKHYDVDLVLHDRLDAHTALYSASIPHENLRQALAVTFGAIYVDGKLVKIDASALDDEGRINIFREK